MIPNKVFKIPTLRCNRCGHRWVPRKSVVYLCPKCKSPRWAEPKA